MSHDPRNDWRYELATHEGLAAHAALSDQTDAFRLLLRLPFLILMIPFYLLRTLKRRREMREFVIERAWNRAVTDDMIKEIAIEWTQLHSDRYPLEQYDPKLPKLTQTFKKTLAKINKRYMTYR